MRGITRRHVWLWLAALLLVGLVSGCRTQTKLNGLVLEPANLAPDFTLTDHQGQPFQLSAQRGKVVLLYFGFTQCPDLCPTTLAEMTNLRRKLGAEGQQVQVALITVDPERDTGEIMAAYLRNFDSTFIGLHGTRAEIDPVIRAYGVTAIKRELPNSALGYTMDHSSFVYVIDQAGRWREQFAHGTPLDLMMNDVRTLIRTGRS